MPKFHVGDPGRMLLLEVSPRDIDFFNKLIEGYDNLALVTTVDAQIGKIALWVSEHYLKDIHAVLRCMPIQVKLLTAE